MTIITAPASSAFETRQERREALDLSIDEELVRGDRRGTQLSRELRAVLTRIVDHELEVSEPLTERMLHAATRLRHLLGGARSRHRLDALAGMGLVRRSDGCVQPTVAGIAAVLRPSLLGSARPPRELLRVLRQAELAAR